MTASVERSGFEVTRGANDDELSTAMRLADLAWLSPSEDVLIERRLPLLRTGEVYLASDAVEGGVVGTSGVFGFEMGLPGGHTAPVSGVTDTAVLTSHRRRGVMAAMMDRVIDDAMAAGRCALVLLASEATIYGRFGFAPASRSKQVRVPIERAQLRDDVRSSSGRVRVVGPQDRGAHLPDIYERSVQRRPGEMVRSEAFWAADLSGPRSDPEENRFCLVHEDDNGIGDGYVLYTVDRHWDCSGPALSVEAVEVVAVDDQAELALWTALFDLDLVKTVTAFVPADTILYGALEDRAAIGVTGEKDHLWVRLLDVPVALGTRRYRTAGQITFDVNDPRGATTGTWRVTAEESGEATVSEAAAADVELRLGVAELSSCWLGGGSFQQLTGLGRVDELAPGAAARADALFGWSPSTWTVHDF